MNKNKHPKKIVILTKNTNIATILTSEQHRCHSKNIKQKLQIQNDFIMKVKKNKLMTAMPGMVLLNIDYFSNNSCFICEALCPWT